MKPISFALLVIAIASALFLGATLWRGLDGIAQQVTVQLNKR